ncbi:hypothetical protein ACFLVR_03185 [Chloroflexota bacterium]
MPQTVIDTTKTALLIIDMQKHFLDGEIGFFAGVNAQVTENTVIGSY